MKKFFGITEKFHFEMGDVNALLTLVNVACIIMGYAWAPWFGLANCVLSIGYMLNKQGHFNFYVMQIALITLNIFFLRG